MKKDELGRANHWRRTQRRRVNAAKIRGYLNRPGLLQPLKTKKGNTVQLLRDQDLEQWWDGVQALALDQDGLLDLLGELGIARAKISPAGLAEQFQKKAKRNFTAKQLIAFLRKHCGATKDELPDSRVEDLVMERAARAVLRASNGKNGQPGQVISSVRIQQDEQAFVGPHYTPGGKNKVGGFKAVDNSTTVTYLRREISVGRKDQKERQTKRHRTFL